MHLIDEVMFNTQRRTLINAESGNDLGDNLKDVRLIRYVLVYCLRNYTITLSNVFKGLECRLSLSTQTIHINFFLHHVTLKYIVHPLQKKQNNQVLRKTTVNISEICSVKKVPK